jgi:hypothetical protein
MYTTLIDIILRRSTMLLTITPHTTRGRFQSIANKT